MESPTGWTYRVALNVARAARPAGRARTARCCAAWCRAESRPPARTIDRALGRGARAPAARPHRDRAALRGRPERSRSRGRDGHRGRYRVGNALGRAHDAGRDARRTKPPNPNRGSTRWMSSSPASNTSCRASAGSRSPNRCPSMTCGAGPGTSAPARALTECRRGRDRGRRHRRGRRRRATTARRRPIRRTFGSRRPTSCSATSTRSCSRRPRRGRRARADPAVARGGGRAGSRRAERERRGRHVRARRRRTTPRRASFTATGVPPRSPILFSYHEGDDAARSSAGGAPAAADEIVVDADLAHARTTCRSATTSHAPSARPGPAVQDRRHVRPAGVDLTGIPLAAMSAASPARRSAVRPHRREARSPGANATSVRDAIALAVGSDYTVVQPSVISFPDQRLAQLEIQHAYWALLSPDAKRALHLRRRPAERAGEGQLREVLRSSSTHGRAAGRERGLPLARRGRARRTASTTAAVRRRSSTIRRPAPRRASTATGSSGRPRCARSPRSSGIKCDGADTRDDHAAQRLRAGRARSIPRSLGAVQRARRSDRDARATRRRHRRRQCAAVRSSKPASSRIRRTRRRRSSPSRAGAPTAPTSVSILYSLQTEGGPSTPWPTNAIATQAADGHWYAASQYACGIDGLAGACPSPTCPDLGPGVEKNAPPASTATAVVGNP